MYEKTLFQAKNAYLARPNLSQVKIKEKKQTKITTKNTNERQAFLYNQIDIFSSV